MKEKPVIEVIGHRGRRTSKFYMTPEQVDGVIKESNKLLKRGIRPSGVDIIFANKRKHFDDATVEQAYPAGEINQN